MELYNIYCDFFFEGMKEISVGVCLNDYTWLEIWKIKWIVQKKKDQVKRKKFEKNGLEQKQKEKKNEERKEVEVQFELYWKVSGIDDIWKEKNCAPLVFRNTLCLIYIFSS